jgi:hypothetical protein
MADDLDYRPDALEPGDEIRFAGSWWEITRKRITLTTTVLDLEREDGATRVAFYRPGQWVAARPKARNEA